MYRTVYVCVGIFVVHLLKWRLRLCVVQQSPDGVYICVYQVLNYAQILLMHACVLKCISMFVQWTFYGVCASAQKRTACKCVYEREREHVHVCGRLSPTEVHPTLVKAQCRVTQVSNGNSTQTGPHRHTYRAGRGAQPGPKSTDELV